MGKIGRFLTALFIVLLPSLALALDYPERPITIVVPFSAGGPTDTVTRLVAEAMSKDLGQQVVVENVTGAGGTLGAGRVAKAAPDGYTLLLHHIGMATSAALYRKLAYKPLEAFDYIGLVTEVPMVIVGRKDLDPAVKTKLYTFLMGYGRIGTADEIKTAKGILADLVWSPFRPSSDNQLIPIRVLEANKNLMKVQGDEKISADEKSKQVAAIRAEIARLEEMQKKAESDQFQKRVAAFVETDKAGNQDELKKMIADFAAGLAATH